MIKISSGETGVIDCLNNQYPSKLYVRQKELKVPTRSTAYGYVYSGVAIVDGIQTPAGYAFCAKESVFGPNFIAAVRYNYIGQQVGAVKVEKVGRLCYIDGCTDTVLIYPPRKGDPTLNSLHFPENTLQTFHTHESIRMGIITEGSGFASLDGVELELNAGDAWCIEAEEKHRFKTETGMTVVAYHPDSDWGPTDEIHPMINKTLIINS